MSKSLIITILLATAGLVIFISGVALPVTLLAVSGVGGLLWLFTRNSRPEDERPSNTVSCCHYLGDEEEG